jgi:hypothetical protein
MRRTCVFLGSLLLLLITPVPALAWWDFIEQFSGPGKFYGWDIQARLFCLIDEIPVKDADGNRDTPDKKTQTRAVVPTTIGIITSTCRTEEVDKENNKKYKHRLSVDIAARFLWADDNPRFANGERISLTTLEPIIWVALLNKFDKGDVLSYGFGVGTYWFSSTEFPSFNGAFIEPVRLELHAPFVWRKHTWSAAIPRFQLGLATFPGGFETSSFAASSDVQPRISRDWVWNGALAFDLSPLLKKLAP